MRTIEEFREATIDDLRSSLRRPAFFGCVGRTADIYYSQILSQLCWLDEREADFASLIAGMLHGAMRVYGQFFDQHLNIPDRFSNEIASTYAQAAYRLGYYTPVRILTEEEFDELKTTIDRDFLMTDHTISEIVSRFGKPTHDVLGGQTTVHCYGSCDKDSNWLCFDYSRCYQPIDPHSVNWFDDPVLRDIRRDKNQMELLPFGSWCREVKGKMDG